MPSCNFTEEDIQNAIAAYTRGDHASTSRTLAILDISRTTLLSRLQKHMTRPQQLLSTVEEEELVAWITNASKLGVATLLPLGKNLVEIRANWFATRSDSLDLPISTRWIDRFRPGYPTLETCSTRPIDASRLKSLNYLPMRSFFDSLSEAIRKRAIPSFGDF